MPFIAGEHFALLGWAHDQLDRRPERFGDRVQQDGNRNERDCDNEHPGAGWHIRIGRDEEADHPDEQDAECEQRIDADGSDERAFFALEVEFAAWAVVDQVHVTPKQPSSAAYAAGQGGAAPERLELGSRSSAVRHCPSRYRPGAAPTPPPVLGEPVTPGAWHRPSLARERATLTVAAVRMGHDGAVNKRALAGLVAMSVVAGACGGGDTADPEAFCELIREGVGVGASNQDTQAQEFDQLLVVAPDEVGEAVQQLSNTTRGLRDIDELDQLFAAAFDPDAQAARADFNEYAVDVCGYTGEALADDQVTSTTDPLNDLRTFISDSFPGEAWASKVRYDITDADGAVIDIRVTFIIGANGDEPIQACNAVSIYAYQVRDASGAVAVFDDELLVAGRDGATGICAET